MMALSPRPYWISVASNISQARETSIIRKVQSLYSSIMHCLSSWQWQRPITTQSWVHHVFNKRGRRKYPHQSQWFTARTKSFSRSIYVSIKRKKNWYFCLEPDHEKYCGGTIYCDHGSQLLHVGHQTSLGASDTVRSTKIFERMALSHGVAIQGYHGDNGIFTA